MQTGVKSAGCEKRIAHEFPSHWWKSMSPWVVLAWKLGASEPRRRRGWEVGVARNLLNTGDACRAAKVECVVERREIWAVARRALQESEVAIVEVLSGCERLKECEWFQEKIGITLRGFVNLETFTI